MDQEAIEAELQKLDDLLPDMPYVVRGAVETIIARIREAAGIRPEDDDGRNQSKGD